jgi:hypothetical protein
LLTELPEDLFQGLSSLQKLALAKNELLELPPKIFTALKCVNPRSDLL